MQVLILAGFVIALTLMDGPALPVPQDWAAPAIGFYLLGAAGLSHANVNWFLRSISRQGQFTRAVRRHHLLSLLTQVWLLGGLAGVILLGYGPWVTQRLRLARVPLASEVAALAPFVVGLLLMWVLDYPFHRAVRRGLAGESFTPAGAVASQAGARAAAGWTRWEYVAYNVRHHLLFVAVPIGLILLARDCISLLASRLLPEHLADYVVLAGLMLSGCAVFVLAPAMVVRIWRTRPLGEGQLRDQLEATCRRLGLKYRQILIWLSGGVIANAGVMGLIWRLRYILLSDGLLERADQRDVEAIFAHEAGHIIHRHIFYAAMFAIGGTALCVSGATLAALLLDWPAWASDSLALGLLGALWGLGFGYVSRRFERQSDVTAAWASGPHDQNDDPDLITHEGAAVFAHALQRVAELNGIPVRQRNWRHGSISQRVAYILYLGSTAGTRRAEDRHVGRIKKSLWALLVLAVAVCLIQWAVFYLYGIEPLTE